MSFRQFTGEAVLHGDRDIEDMLSSLGEILHYTIDHSNEMTTIAQEILRM